MLDALWMFLAACAAGAVNAVAGGGTLISFPVLLWLGRDAVLANATNALALWPGNLAAAWGFREELRGALPWVKRLALPTVLGSLAGGWVLLRTPSPTFRGIVPFLILAAALLMAFQGRIRIFLPHGSRRRRWGAAGLQFLVGLYVGYFGAGAGILTLATLGLLGLEDIHQMNGVKAILVAGANGFAAAYFVLSGAILWPDALWLALGAVVGGYAATHVARAVGPEAVGRFTVVVGVLAALVLLARV